jgi:hypothetical protein
MRCEEIRELLSAYIDDMLDGESRKEVEAHLGACPSCSKEEKALRNLVRELNSLEKAKAPDDFLRQVRQRIQRRNEFERMMRPVFPFKAGTQLKLTGVLVTVILGIAVYKILEPGMGLQPGPREIPFPPPVSAPAPIPEPAQEPAVTVEMKEQDTGTGELEEKKGKSEAESAGDIASSSASGAEQTEIDREEKALPMQDGYNTFGAALKAPQKYPTLGMYDESRKKMQKAEADIDESDSIAGSSPQNISNAVPVQEENVDMDLTLSLQAAETFSSVSDRIEAIVTGLRGNTLGSRIEKESGDYLFTVQIPSLKISEFEARIREFCLTDTLFPKTDAPADALLTVRLRFSRK